MKHLSSTLVQWNHPWWSKGKFNQNSFSLSFSKFISIDFQSLNHVISLFFIFVSCLRNLPSGNRKWNYQELMIIKKNGNICIKLTLWIQQILEDNSWHDNPKNVIIIPWILLFSEGLSALSVWNTSKFFHFVSKLFLNFVFPFFVRSGPNQQPPSQCLKLEILLPFTQLYFIISICF